MLVQGCDLTIPEVTTCTSTTSSERTFHGHVNTVAPLDSWSSSRGLFIMLYTYSQTCHERTPCGHDFFIRLKGWPHNKNLTFIYNGDTTNVLFMVIRVGYEECRNQKSWFQLKQWNLQAIFWHKTFRPYWPFLYRKRCDFNESLESMKHIENLTSVRWRGGSGVLNFLILFCDM